ncbi:MAG: hypothetical protein O7A08_06315 [SAR324 cluster bacterium]|nr:hypothetical protein [SAR324 cluster bacterium]MCZ6532560.1 hypothetical protein [SAR324 cluster bacterium]MCZ6728843.1 hypothetical protein [SAR324 cluster bacterium]MCZ6841411.1 hypothetical protein [SAR324 cluster bacterium]
MKRETVISPTGKDAKKNVAIFDLNLDKDNPILCTPTGERWRIVSVDSDKISFEKIT